MPKCTYCNGTGKDDSNWETNTCQMCMGTGGTRGCFCLIPLLLLATSFISIATIVLLSF